MSKKLYLAYGSNLNLEQMAHRCPTAKVVGKAEINNMQLLFRGPYESAVATIEPRKGSAVPILVWEITPEDEAALDRYEGFPFLYRKENFKVSLDGKKVSGMAYVMNEGRPLGTPSCHYYSIIYEGYMSAGFDTEILKKAVADSMED